MPKTSTRTMELVRVTLNFPQDVYEEVKELASRRGITITETIRRAVAVELYLEENPQLLADSNPGMKAIKRMK